MKHEKEYTYHSLYNTKKWVSIRENQLLKQPFCYLCKSTKALQIDHIFDHKGDEELFINSKNLQTLCVEHHTMKGSLDKYCNNLVIGQWSLYLDYSKSYDLDSYDLLTHNRLRSLTKFFNEIKITNDKIVLFLGSLDLGSQKHLVNLAMKKMKSRPFSVKFLGPIDDWVKNTFIHYCLSATGGSLKNP